MELLQRSALGATSTTVSRNIPSNNVAWTQPLYADLCVRFRNESLPYVRMAALQFGLSRAKIQSLWLTVAQA